MKKVKIKVNANCLKTLIAFVACLSFVILFFMMHVFPVTITRNEDIYVCVIAVLISISFSYSFFMVKKESFKYEKIFLITILIWGAIFSLVLPPYTGHDEDDHFETAYYYSNEIINSVRGIEEEPKKEKFVYYGRKKSGEEVSIYDVLPIDYNVISNSSFIGVKDSETRNITTGYVLLWWYKAIPTIIGCIIGRGLLLGKWGILFFARYFNTLFCAVLGYFAIKKLPYAKKEMTLVAFIPCFPWLFSTYNYDAVFIAIGIYFISSCLCVGDKDLGYIRLCDIASIIIPALLICYHKIYYVFIVIIGVIILFDSIKQALKRFSLDKLVDEIKKISKTKQVILVLVGIMITLMVLFVFGLGLKVIRVYCFNLEAYNGNTILMILRHPKQYMSLWIRTILVRESYLFGGFVGNRLITSLTIPVLLEIMVLLSVVHTVSLGDEYQFSKIKRGLAVLVAFGFFFATLLGTTLRDTPPGSEYVTQLWTRYIMPIPFMVFPLYTKREVDECEVKKGLFLNNLVLILLILYYIWNIYNRSYDGTY